MSSRPRRSRESSRISTPPNTRFSEESSSQSSQRTSSWPFPSFPSRHSSSCSSYSDSPSPSSSLQSSQIYQWSPPRSKDLPPTSFRSSTSCTRLGRSSVRSSQDRSLRRRVWLRRGGCCRRFVRRWHLWAVCRSGCTLVEIGSWLWLRRRKRRPRSQEAAMKEDSSD